MRLEDCAEDAKRLEARRCRASTCRNDVLQITTAHAVRAGWKSVDRACAIRAIRSGFETPPGVDRPSAEPSLAK